MIKFGNAQPADSTVGQLRSTIGNFITRAPSSPAVLAFCGDVNAILTPHASSKPHQSRQHVQQAAIDALDGFFGRELAAVALGATASDAADQTLHRFRQLRMAVSQAARCEVRPSCNEPYQLVTAPVVGPSGIYQRVLFPAREADGFAVGYIRLTEGDFCLGVPRLFPTFTCETLSEGGVICVGGDRSYGCVVNLDHNRRIHEFASCSMIRVIDKQRLLFSVHTGDTVALFRIDCAAGMPGKVVTGPYMKHNGQAQFVSGSLTDGSAVYAVYQDTASTLMLVNVDTFEERHIRVGHEQRLHSVSQPNRAEAYGLTRAPSGPALLIDISKATVLPIQSDRRSGLVNRIGPIVDSRGIGLVLGGNGSERLWYVDPKTWSFASRPARTFRECVSVTSPSEKQYVIGKVNLDADVVINGDAQIKKVGGTRKFSLKMGLPVRWDANDDGYAMLPTRVRGERGFVAILSLTSAQLLTCDDALLRAESDIQISSGGKAFIAARQSKSGPAELYQLGPTTAVPFLRGSTALSYSVAPSTGERGNRVSWAAIRDEDFNIGILLLDSGRQVALVSQHAHDFEVWRSPSQENFVSYRIPNGTCCFEYGGRDSHVSTSFLGERVSKIDDVVFDSDGRRAVAVLTLENPTRIGVFDIFGNRFVDPADLNLQQPAKAHFSLAGGADSPPFDNSFVYLQARLSVDGETCAFAFGPICRSGF